MADFGANYPCFKKRGANTGVVIGKLVTANVTPTLASGELYADDDLAEQLSEFVSASCAMETDDMVDDVASEIYGCTVEENVVHYNKDDTPPIGALCYYKKLLRNGVKFYKGYYYPKVRASIGNDNAQTKGNNITFGTTSTTFTIFADDTTGNWRDIQTFQTAEACIAWINELMSIGEPEGA